MKVFVWEDVDTCCDRYHSSGGVVVFADSEERARELANQQDGCAIKDTEMPSDVREVIGGNEAVFIMPNAGCC